MAATRFQMGTGTVSRPVVGALSSLLAAANPTRTHLVLLNSSNEGIEIRLGVPAVWTEAVPLAAGGIFQIGLRNHTTEAIYGVSAAGGVTVVVAENMAGFVGPGVMELAPGDEAVGAVEIKDASVDDRAEVVDANTASSTTTHVLRTQHIAGSGKVQPSGADAVDPLWVAQASASVSALSGWDVLHSPNDFTSTWVSATVLQLVGLDYVPTSEQFVKVKQVANTGVSNVLTPGENGMVYDPVTGRLTVVGATFLATDSFEVEVYGPRRAFSKPGDYAKSTRMNPEWTRVEPEVPAEVTNGPDNTYNYYVDMKGFGEASIMVVMDGGAGVTGGAGLSATLTATPQDDDTPANLCAYDASGLPVLVCAVAASSTDTWNYHLVIKFLHIQVVVDTGGDNDADWAIYLLKRY